MVTKLNRKIERFTVYFSFLESMFGFFRGEGGELRLGTRRATRPRNFLPETIMPNSNSFTEILAGVANAISTKTTFDVFYSPR